MTRSTGNRRATLWRSLLALAALAVASPVWGASGPAVQARGAGAYDSGNPRVEAMLVVDAAELAPGESVRVGVLFELDPGWHIYWRNAGESGLPTELDYRFPGARVGPIRWPVPKVFRESDGFLTTYGYSTEVLLASEAVVEARGPGMARIEVEADFVTCQIGCIPGSITLGRDIPVTPSGKSGPGTVSELFDTWEQRLPHPADALGIEVEALHSQNAVRPNDEFKTALTLRCTAPACGGLRLAPAESYEAFLPEPVEALDLQPVGHDGSAEDGFSLVLAGRAFADEPGELEQPIRGLIPVQMAGRETVHVRVSTTLPRAAEGALVLDNASPLWAVAGGFVPRPSAPGLGLLYALGLALLGGLVLNLMPCVLPVLAIKVFHVAELAHESRRTVLGHGVAYTTGVLASMAALAAIVVGLRLAGTAVGWGFQFQEPLFVAAICTLLVVFALNLFGLFEVTFQPAGAAGVGAEATGYRRSFFEGLLAVILATPCTAPFLGTAVGFAFASSTGVIFGIFLAIGFGLAAPYALVTLVPGWARIIPRPGAWMIQVRRALGFSLVATVVWLLWVVGRSVGVDAQALLLGYLVAVSFGVWVFGSLQRTGRTGLALSSGAAVATAAVLGLGALPLEPQARTAQATSPAPAATAASEAWRPWDPDAIAAELARGRPVFVDFTADWCITCKVNESVVFEDERFKSEIERLDFATFLADWTLYDEEIRAVLASFGKAGVPMYLVYRPDAPTEPQVLPELLTVDIVLEALRSAVGPPGTRAAAEPTRPEKTRRKT